MCAIFPALKLAKIHRYGQVNFLHLNIRLMDGSLYFNEKDCTKEVDIRLKGSVDVYSDMQDVWNE